jgi:hypothetical protein
VGLGCEVSSLIWKMNKIYAGMALTKYDPIHVLDLNNVTCRFFLDLVFNVLTFCLCKHMFFSICIAM